MFKSKFIIFTALTILFVFISNVGMTEEQQYSPEMVENCLKLSEGVDVSDWVIDEDLPDLDDSKLNALDDGWNKQIQAAHELMLKTCSGDKESDECWLAKNPERKLRKNRRKCYYGLMMKDIHR